MPRSSPSTAPSPWVLQRSFNFFIPCLCTTLILFFFLERIWWCLIFFPEGSRYFQRGVCALSAYSSFQTGKCPSLPGWGGGTAQLAAPDAAGGFGLRTPQLPKGDPLRWWGEPWGSPEPRAALGRGVPGSERAPIPPCPAAGPGGGNPPSSSAGKASLTRANENNQK